MKLYNFELTYLYPTLSALYESGIIQAESERCATMKLEKRYRHEIESGFRITLGDELEFGSDGICVTYEFENEIAW